MTYFRKRKLWFLSLCC